MKKEMLLLMLVVFGVIVSSDFGSWDAHLNATSANNCSCDNLSLWTSLDSNSSLKEVVSWYVNGNPIQVLNLPFEDNFSNVDEQTTDFSGYNHDVYLYGPVLMNGSYDGFSYLNFSDRSRVEVHDYPELNISENLTIVAWIRSELNGSNLSYVVDKGSNKTNYALYINNSGRILFSYTNTQNHTFYANANISQGNWHFVAVAVNKTHIWMFLDGNELSVYPNASLPEEITPQGGPLYIGRKNPVQFDPTMCFIGGIDDLRIFDRTLSPLQIGLIYRNESVISSEETGYGDTWQAKVFFFDKSGNYENRTSNELNVSSFPNITINKPSAVELRNKLSVEINISIDQTGYIWYSVDSSENRTLCSNCSFGEAVYFLDDYGNHTLTAYALNGCNYLSVRKTNFSVEKDSDLDGTPDSLDSDDDGDGIADVNDSLIGNEENVATNLSSLSVSVNSSSNLSQRFEGVQVVNFTNGSSTLISFRFNFSDGKLDLSNVTVRQGSNSNNQNQILIRGINLSYPYNKTVYLRKINSSTNSVCVHDAEAFSMSEASSGCSGSDESVVPCPGNNGSYSCSVVGDFLKVSGLRHSILFEFVQASSSSENNSNNQSSNSNENSNSNSNSNDDEEEEECTTYWNCTAWGPCVGGVQKRNCTKVDEDCTNSTKPATERNCSKGNNSLKEDIKISKDGGKFFILLNLSKIMDYLNATKVNMSIVVSSSDGKEVYRVKQQLDLAGNESRFNIDGKFAPGDYNVSIKFDAGNKSYEVYKNFSVAKPKKRNLTFLIPIMVVAILVGAGFLIKKYVGLMRVGKYKIQIFLKQRI